MLAVVYAAVICASLYMAYELRFDFVVPEQHQFERVRLLALVVGIKLIALVLARQLGTLLTYFSIPDLIRLFWAMAGSTTLLMVPRIFGWAEFTAPRGVLLADFLLCFGALCAGRVIMRLYRERLSGAKRAATGVQPQLQRIAIIGAGDAGASLAKEFISHPSRGFRPVMFFDDDREKHGKLVHGIPVLGPPEAVSQAKDVGSLTKAVIAMPSATAKRIREIVTVFTHQGLKVETLPSLEELASGRVRASRVRPVEVQDLLGREAVNLDSAGIKLAIEGKRVLVTGAGGSIGSELCRQIAALNPKRLLLVEQAEGALFLIEQELNELGLGSFAVPLVADILDTDRMEYIFSRYQPEVVFHAAAHKHVYLMERQPAEAIRNNVLGTRQLARLAAAHGVEAFTFISTDKAINPTNVMGATKRLAEIQLMVIAASQGEARANGETGNAEKLKLVAAEKHRMIGFPVVAAASGQPSAVSGQGAAISRQPSALSGEPQKIAPEFVEAVSAAGTNLESRVTNPARRTPTKFMAVRFGNVLGSSGSVIPIFKFTGLKPGEKLFEELQHHTEKYTEDEPRTEGGRRMSDIRSPAAGFWVLCGCAVYSPHLDAGGCGYCPPCIAVGVVIGVSHEAHIRRVSRIDAPSLSFVAQGAPTRAGKCRRPLAARRASRVHSLYASRLH